MKRKADVWGVLVYFFAVVVCLYFLLYALIHRNEVTYQLDFFTAGPALVFCVFRLCILGTRVMRGKKKGRESLGTDKDR